VETEVSDTRIRVTAATPPLPSWSESRSGESVATDNPSGHAIASVPIDKVFVRRLADSPPGSPAGLMQATSVAKTI